MKALCLCVLGNAIHLIECRSLKAHLMMMLVLLRVGINDLVWMRTVLLFWNIELCADFVSRTQVLKNIPHMRECQGFSVLKYHMCVLCLLQVCSPPPKPRVAWWRPPTASDSVLTRGTKPPRLKWPWRTTTVTWSHNIWNENRGALDFFSFLNQMLSNNFVIFDHPNKWFWNFWTS